MQLDYIFAAIFTVIILYIPGLIIMLGLRVSPIISWAIAPAVSGLGYVLLTFIYQKLDIFCTWYLLFVPLVALSLIGLLISRLILPNKSLLISLPQLEGKYIFNLVSSKNSPQRKFVKFFDLLNLCLYIVVGIVITYIFYLSKLGSFESFPGVYDDFAHFAYTKALLVTGQWTPFPSNYYPDNPAINPFGDVASGFYPHMWILINACIQNATHLDINECSNVLNFVIISIVFSSSLCLFHRIVFSKRVEIILLSCITGYMFAAFPWVQLESPLFPTIFASSLLLAYVSIVVNALNNKSKDCIVASIIVTIVLTISIIFIQTNIVFGFLYLLIPIFVIFAARYVYSKFSESKLRLILGIFSGIIVFVVIFAMLYFIANLDFLAGIVSDDTATVNYLNTCQAIVNFLFVGFLPGYPSPNLQIVPAFMIMVGLFFCFKKKDYLWIAISYLFVSIMLMYCATHSDQLQNLFSGFFYNDPTRLMIIYTLSAIPLVGVGLYSVFCLIMNFMPILKIVTVKIQAVATGVVLLSLAFAINLFPDGNGLISRLSSGLSFELSVVQNLYQNDQSLSYREGEPQFVEEVKTITNGDLVLNIPTDGSAAVYALDGLNIYNRYIYGYPTISPSSTAGIINTHIAEVASNEELVNCLQEVDARYVMLLDGDSENGSFHQSFSNDDNYWRSYYEITPSTPGFDLVLHQDDMYLYKIVY